jgi:hypothetical protein
MSQMPDIRLFTAQFIITPAGRTLAYPFIASSFKIGRITLQNIEAAYAPTAKDNLLGGSFLQNFTYTIDEIRQVVYFSPIDNNVRLQDNAAQALSEGYAIVDGKKYIMCHGHVTQSSN